MSAPDSFCLVMAIRILAALVFLRAAAAKWRSPAAFEGVVGNYDLLPRALVAPVAAVLPVAEALIAAALLVPLALRARPESAAAALLVVFAIAMGVNLARGRTRIDCGCGDPRAGQTLRPSLVVRNLALAALLVVAGLAPVGQASPGGWLIAAAAAGAAFMLYLCHEAFAAPEPRASRT
jgi:hypothetical protein